MCNPASFVLTKDRVFWSKRTDSHSEIIKEFGLHEHGVRGPNVVNVEICPPKGDMRKPLDEWVFSVDQDQLPDWATPQSCEQRARSALPEWIAANVIFDDYVRGYVCSGERVFVCGGLVRCVWGGTVEWVENNGIVELVTEHGLVKEVRGGGTVQEVRCGTVERVLDHGTVHNVTDYGTVTAVYGQGTVGEVGGHGTVVVVHTNGKVELVRHYGTINRVESGGTVEAVCNFGTVCLYKGANDTKPRGPFAVVIDRRGHRAACIMEDTQ